MTLLKIVVARALLAACAWGVAGCATQAGGEAPVPADATGSPPAEQPAADSAPVPIEPSDDRAERVCINVRRIDGFDAIDDRHLTLSVSRDEHYLLVMAPGCFGLQSALGIGFANRGMTRMCDNDFAKVAYRDFARGAQLCTIMSMQRVESRAAAKALVEAKRKAGG